MIEFSKDAYEAEIFKIAQFLIIDHDLKIEDLSNKMPKCITQYIDSQVAGLTLPSFIHCIRFSDIDLLDHALQFGAFHREKENWNLEKYMDMVRYAMLGSEIGDKIIHQLMNRG